MRAIHLSREARHRHDLDGVTDERGAFGVADVAEARRAAHRINIDRAAGRAPGPPTVTAGELIAVGVLHEVFHRLVDHYETSLAPGAVSSAIEALPKAAGKAPVDRALKGLAREFGRPPAPPGHDAAPPADADAARSEALVEALLLSVINQDPAAAPLRGLFDDRGLRKEGAYPKVLKSLEAQLEASGLGPGQDAAGLPGRVVVGRSSLAGRSLPQLLRAPSAASPTSLAGQLRWIREHWAELIADIEGLEDRLLLASDLVAEEERAQQQRFGGGPAAAETPDFGGLEAEPERFSDDTEWMPRVVLQAKSTYVWLDQLSRRYERDIGTLDAVPDEELDRLASWGVTGLWLIGLWQRSRASEQIKRLRGNPDAAASAYSLDDYRIADDLGGEAAYAALRDRAAFRGIRLASDMVPNHMGIDSRWVIRHPDRFLAVPEAPYPAYAFSGPDLSSDPGVEILLEDHYWDSSDAAVVFRRRDTTTGDIRFVYHGNDGTSFPWNDTAQLDYLKAEVREAVIRTILDVARRFPIIRFDAAMVLAKRHVRRLWWPERGAADGIPSRAEHALSRAAFEAAMPQEFWREVVDRVAAEVPGTLLLAEAFWLMEGYFVRTLGMHRVYNSAFMHMLRDEDGAGYRKVIRETLEFDPAILGRYVNFMSNPDEKTALEQFGDGDKYFGVATVLATLPGLPMLAHGQVEGLGERYGMEFRRATLDESVNHGLVERHQQELFPLFRQRRRFAGATDFRLYDAVTDGGGVDEHVFAYSNGRGLERSLVVYHDRFGSAHGRIRASVAFAVVTADGERRLERSTLAEALGLSEDPAAVVSFRDPRTGHGLVATVGEIRERGLELRLGAYESHAWTDIEEHASSDAAWTALADELQGGWVPSLAAALADVVARQRRDAARALAADPERPLASHVPRLEHRLQLEDGRTLAVAEWGDPAGTPVLLLHGQPGSRLFSPDPATTEAMGVRLITFDRPGYGASDPLPGRSLADSGDEVADVAARLDLGPIHVVGWSSGGPVALAAIARHPDVVRSIALVASNAAPDDVPPSEWAASAESLEIAEAARRGDPSARDRALARLAWFVENPTVFIDQQRIDDAAAGATHPDARLRARPGVFEAFRTHFAEAGRSGAGGFADDWLAWLRPWGFDPADIEGHVDIWWGEDDPLTSRVHVGALARRLPAARLRIVPDAGHGLVLGAWREILEALLGVDPRGPA